MKLSTWMFVLLVVLVGAVMVSGCGPGSGTFRYTFSNLGSWLCFSRYLNW